MKVPIPWSKKHGYAEFQEKPAPPQKDSPANALSSSYFYQRKKKTVKRKAELARA
jgi:hypothetical protein